MLSKDWLILLQQKQKDH